MINLIVIAISAIMFALLLVWWRWPAFRVWIEAPKYSMLRQERRFDDQQIKRGPGANSSLIAATDCSE
jgi:hypothetical protein